MFLGEPRKMSIKCNYVLGFDFYEDEVYCKVWTRKLLEREGPVSEVGGTQEEALVAGQGQYVPL